LSGDPLPGEVYTPRRYELAELLKAPLMTFSPAGIVWDDPGGDWRNWREDEEDGEDGKDENEKVDRIET
jgi:hypothetical protein